jgi:hypothetical protein
VVTSIKQSPVFKHHKLYTGHLIPFVYNLGWPDLQNEVKTVQKKEIRFSSKEDVTRISENHKVNLDIWSSLY